MWLNIDEKQQDSNESNPIYLGIILAYLLPILIYSVYISFIISSHKQWTTFILGLLLSVAGTFLLILLARSWEFAVDRKIELTKLKYEKPTKSIPRRT